MTIRYSQYRIMEKNLKKNIYIYIYKNLCSAIFLRLASFIVLGIACLSLLGSSASFLLNSHILMEHILQWLYIPIEKGMHRS